MLVFDKVLIDKVCRDVGQAPAVLDSPNPRIEGIWRRLASHSAVKVCFEWVLAASDSWLPLFETSLSREVRCGFFCTPPPPGQARLSALLHCFSAKFTVIARFSNARCRYR